MPSSRFRIRSLAVIILLVLTCQTSHARDWYVNNVKGTNTNRGNSPDQPFKSIQHALRNAGHGDRIIIANTGAPYRESISLAGKNHSGDELNAFTIVGNGAVLDGRQKVVFDQWRHHDGEIFKFQPARKGTQVLYLGGRPARRAAIADRNQLATLPVEQWTMVDGWIYFRVKPTVAPWEYDLSYCGHSVGITLYRVKNVLIQDLIVQGFSIDGVNLHDGTQKVLLSGLNCRGNGRSGISIGGASRAAVSQCTVGDNFEAQIRTEGYIRLRINQCELIESDLYGPTLKILGGHVVRDGEVQPKSK